MLHKWLCMFLLLLDLIFLAPVVLHKEDKEMANRNCFYIAVGNIFYLRLIIQARASFRKLFMDNKDEAASLDTDEKSGIAITAPHGIEQMKKLRAERENR